MYNIEYLTIKDKLEQNGYRRVDIKELEESIVDIFVNRQGKVISLRIFDGGYKTKQVKISKTENGYLKYNIYTHNKQCKTRMLAQDVYNTFRGTDFKNQDIYYIDDNKENCTLDNLVSITSLLTIYRKVKNS